MRGSALSECEQHGDEHSPTEEWQCRPRLGVAGRGDPERVERDRGGEQQHARGVESAARGSGGVLVLSGQGGERGGEESERDHGREDRGPSGDRDQNAAESGSGGGADRGGRPEQTHGPSQPVGRDHVAGACEWECHHHGGADALKGARGDQRAERGCECTQECGAREDSDPDAQDAAAAEQIAEVADREARRGHREQVGEGDPLRLREGTVQLTGDRGERHVGGARAERGDQHAEGEAGRRRTRPGGCRGCGGHGSSLDPWVMNRQLVLLKPGCRGVLA